MSTATAEQLAPSDIRLLSAREAAEKLGVSTRTLWTLTNCGDIASVRIGRTGRTVRYCIEHLREYIEKNTTR